MAEILQLDNHRRRIVNYHVIKKVIDGEMVEYVNFDALTQTQRRKLFSDAQRFGAPKLESYGAPID